MDRIKKHLGDEQKNYRFCDGWIRNADSTLSNGVNQFQLHNVITSGFNKTQATCATMAMGDQEHGKKQWMWLGNSDRQNAES